MVMCPAVHEEMLPRYLKRLQKVYPLRGFHEPPLQAAVMDMRGVKAEMAGVQ
jgi:hypothetical protein